MLTHAARATSHLRDGAAQTATPPSAMWRWRLQALVALCVTLLATPRAVGQELGRWSWNGLLRGERRQTNNSLGEQATGAFGERRLRLDLGVDGFVVHPRFMQIRLGLNTELSDFSGGGARNARRWGADARVRLLPVGARRLTLFASRQSYDYSAPTEQDPLTLRGVPDSATSIGGQLMITRGRLRGVTASVQRARLTFLDESSDPELRGHERIHWSSVGRQHKRMFRLERRFRDFGTVDFSSEDLNASYEQLSPPAAAWRWDMSNFASRRQVASNRAGTSTFDSLRTRQSLRHVTAGDHVIDLRYTGGLTHASDNPALQSHALFGRYRRRVRPSLEIAPFVGYTLQLQDDASLRSPAFGLLTVWSRHREAYDLQLLNSLSLALRQRSASATARSGSALVLSIQASAGRGDERAGLRTQLDGSWNHNRLRTGDDLIPELPDLGTSSGLGSENSWRGRLTLSKRWRALSFRVSSEATRRATSPGEGQTFRVDSLRNSGQLTFARLTLGADATSSRVITATEEQRVDVLTASLSWRPLRMLSLWALYRDDQRQLELAPDLQSERFESGAELGVGAFVVLGRWFRIQDRTPGLRARATTGFEIAISRRFGGLLPFVTGRAGGGVIK